MPSKRNMELIDMATRKLTCDHCGKEIKPLHHRVTVYNPTFRRELKWQYYHGDCYTKKILKDNNCKVD